MLKNTLINRIATQRVANALGELNDQAVYVGGAVVSLYIDDPAADDVRPTKDIDISLEIASLGQLEKLRLKLNQKGFMQSSEDTVMCRFRYDDIKVDVMSTTEIGWAPANRWFEPGFNQSIEYQLDEFKIRLLPLPYFLATKFDAFKHRGSIDPRTSHDFEDIVYLLNHTSDIADQISSSDKDVRNFIVSSFQMILDSPSIQEAILGNLFYEEQEVRFDLIIRKLKETVERDN
jgi:hypothetical protein